MMEAISGADAQGAALELAREPAMVVAGVQESVASVVCASCGVFTVGGFSLFVRCKALASYVE